MLPTQICAFLSNSSLFSELTAETLAQVAGKAHIQRYEASGMILWQGQPSGDRHIDRPD